MSWISINGFAKMMHVSERAIRKAIASGKYQTRTAPHPSRKDQISYEIWMDNDTWNKFLLDQGYDNPDAR